MAESVGIGTPPTRRPVQILAEKIGIPDLSAIESMLIEDNAKATKLSLKDELEAIFPYLIRVRALRSGK